MDDVMEQDIFDELRLIRRNLSVIAAAMLVKLSPEERLEQLDIENNLEIK